MASVLRFLNWLIHRLTEHYDKLEEPEPAPLPQANAHATMDRRKPL